MKIYHFTCTLLSEVVLTTAAGSESPAKSLDYIPGAKFLGITSNELYDEASRDTQTLFHSGKVRFGNAYPNIDQKSFIPVPNVYFTEKGKGLESEVYLHHNVSKSDLQLKQSREGYIHINGKSSQQITLDQNFKLKSGYDAEKRRSEDSKMFGYFSLPVGSTWSFSVSDDTGEFENQIKNALTGERKIGRSKTAEYGLIKISFEKTTDVITSEEFASPFIIYALSDLCFLNDFGDTTSQPTSFQLTGDSTCEIDWNLSQLRTRIYQNWNGKRGARDADRIIIQKGSVFFVKGKNKLKSDFFDSGLGSFKAEGFGQVVVNPDFLSRNDAILPFTFEKIKIESDPLFSYPKEIQDQLNTQVDALKTIVKRGKASETIRTEVLKFKKDHQNEFKGVNNSQWGMLGGYASQALNADVFEKMVFDSETGALFRGASEQNWRTGRKRLHDKFLEVAKYDKLKAMLFIKKLVKEMPLKDHTK
ncbi:hypothetical protein [Algoriphagus chordae]|uniref:Uncharacterized protein n=1 Tax=Algoriphagus chordae TaxID=237019 RepID=A0A2W7R2D7_9BACT|nr:hypothetical protein [Algoriphagus chordae]PZX48289.1 hypothetical protein LV85_03699 [Algoriphagus chordae]